MSGYKKTQMVDKYLITGGNVLEVDNPLDHLGMYITVPSTLIAKGESSKSFFWITTQMDLSAAEGFPPLAFLALLQYIKDCRITVDVKVVVTQIPSAKPTIRVFYSYTGYQTDWTYGYPENKVYITDWYQVISANGTGYYIVTPDNNLSFDPDPNRWLRNVLNDIELEWMN